MGHIEEIEKQLEVELKPEIDAAVAVFQSEIEMNAKKSGMHLSHQEIEARLYVKREEVKQRIMCPQDRARIQKGFRILMREIQALPECSQIIYELDSAAQKYDSIKDQIGGETEIQDLLGISQKTYNIFHSIAYALFEEGYEEKNLEAPASILVYLTNLNRCVFESQLLLGYTLMLLGEYESSIISFDSASKLKPEDPEPYLRKGMCYMAIGNHVKADDTFNFLEQVLADSSELPAYREMIHSLKSKEV